MYEPIKISIPEKAKLISVGLSHTFAVSESDQIYYWMQGFHDAEALPTLVELPEANLKIVDIKSSN